MKEDLENDCTESEESEGAGERLSELEERLDGIENRLDDVESQVDDAECVAEDAASSAVDDLYAKETNKMYLFTQDKKLLTPFLYVEARRIKKGEDPYAIIIQINNNNSRRGGTYPNKEAALAEMARIAAALRDGKTYFEMQ